MTAPLDPFPLLHHHYSLMTNTLTPELVLRAYCLGIFPMAKHADETTVYWVQPEQRGVIPFETFHISKRLQRTINSGLFTVTRNTAFDDVIEACAAPEAGRPDTWLNGPLKQLYKDLHTIGYAHSVEVWHDGALVGGLYGVSLGRMFFGESMFHTMRDASKVALVHLVQHLQAQGFAMLDTQFITEHLRQFGAVEVSRSEFSHMLQAALDGDAVF